MKKFFYIINYFYRIQKFRIHNINKFIYFEGSRLNEMKKFLYIINYFYRIQKFKIHNINKFIYFEGSRLINKNM